MPHQYVDMPSGPIGESRVPRVDLKAKQDYCKHCGRVVTCRADGTLYPHDDNGGGPCVGRDNPHVRHFLDLSTAHLPAEAREHLRATDGVHAYELRKDSWQECVPLLMWVPDDPDESAAAEDDPPPEWVLVIQRYARAVDCDYVLFDPDADTAPQLPVFPDDPEELTP